ncbi:MAG: hypothetical protein J3Q66DRAFT_397311 [Benniella sp.]|nr:MAG: hypothetical protein J3Q66DRAFT_397311 [Benniella sp.]
MEEADTDHHRAYHQASHMTKKGEHNFVFKRNQDWQFSIVPDCGAMFKPWPSFSRHTQACQDLSAAVESALKVKNPELSSHARIILNDDDGQPAAESSVTHMFQAIMKRLDIQMSAQENILYSVNEAKLATDQSLNAMDTKIDALQDDVQEQSVRAGNLDLELARIQDHVMNLKQEYENLAKKEADMHKESGRKRTFDSRR